MRRLVAAACILAASTLYIGCAHTDYVYDYYGNVVSTPVSAGKAHAIRHGMHAHPAATPVARLRTPVP